MRNALALLGMVGVLAATTVSPALPSAQTAKPSITISTVPPLDQAGGADRMERIAGAVVNAPGDARIVIFARTNTWWVQPYAKSPYTTIEKGRWTTDTHLGIEYAALLVRPAYNAPATTATLPDVGGDVLAVTRVPGKK